MTVIDVAPFIVAFIVGVLCGRFIASGLAWVVAVALPTAHFVLSVVTGRAGEDLLSYVIPINAALACAAAAGVVLGRLWLRTVR